MRPELVTVVACTVGLPFLVLVSDYMFRVEANLITVMRMSGPDLCLLGLGAVGSIFIDPKVVAALHGLPPLVPGIAVIFVIFILRGLCFRLGKSTTNSAAYVILLSGVLSLTLVSGILVYSYWNF
jgi:hypothetical protein